MAIFAPEISYQFKHALIRDAAYEALLKSRRRELHNRVARTITERFPAIAEAEPETVARHWTEAGETEPAVAAWKKAGDAADARRAFREAEESYRQALAMLNTMPEARGRNERELELVSAIVRALQRTRGYAARETIEVLEHARALAEKTGNLAQLVLQVFSTFGSLLVSGDHPGATALADQVFDLAEREGSSTSLAFAHSAQGLARWYRGDLVGADEHFVRLSRVREAAGFRQFPGMAVITLGYSSFSAWALGRVDSARERIAEALAFSRNSKNPYDQAVARYFESSLYAWLKESKRAETAAREALKLCEEQGFPYFAARNRINIGCARAQLGITGEGISLIHLGLADLVESGQRPGITDVLARLAEAQAIEGVIDVALQTIEEALKANPDEFVYRPEIFRVRGELLVKLARTDLAETDFRAAIELAARMSAKSWELRATMSLARLLRDTGRLGEARAMLAEIYNWFTEGFDTVDLKDAKALLDELSA